MCVTPTNGEQIAVVQSEKKTNKFDGTWTGKITGIDAKGEVFKKYCAFDKNETINVHIRSGEVNVELINNKNKTIKFQTKLNKKGAFETSTKWGEEVTESVSIRYRSDALHPDATVIIDGGIEGKVLKGFYMLNNVYYDVGGQKKIRSQCWGDFELTRKPSRATEEAAKKTATKRGSLPPCPEQGVWNNCVGTFTYPDGNKYVGEWKNDKKHGQGTYAEADGSKYVGEWKDGIRYGQGTQTYADGRVAEGIFENNNFLYAKKLSPTVTAKKSPEPSSQVQSSLPPCRGDYIADHWKNCFGRYIHANGDKYAGEFKDAKKHGQGTETFANGDKYVGEWRNGNRHGKGTLTYSDGTVIEGIWRDGRFPSTETVITAERKKELLAQEQKLLEEAKRVVEAGRKKKEEQQRIRRLAKEKEIKLAKQKAQEQKLLEEAKRVVEAERKKRRIAKARAAAKREKAVYDALVVTANADLAVAQDFIAAHPGTPALLDIVTYIAGTKAALKKGNGSRVKSALSSLRATLSKEKGFSTFLALKEKKRKQRLVAERRLAEEKRKQEIAEAKRQKEEKKRRRAAQVIILKEDLKSYAGFLKRQITQLVKSSPETAQALVPVIKSLEGGLSSNDLSALKKLKGKANADLRKHGLANQFTQVQKLMAVARKAKREKVAAAERRAKARKEEAVRLTAERKVAQKKEAALEALSARQEKYREAVAVVIGNRKYANRVPEVSFAHNDARAMRKYLIDLGYREGNIIYIRDATQSQLLAVFGTKENHRGKLFSYVRPGESDVTVFYSGHGVPGLKDRRGYLLPVDADPNLVELNGYPIDLLYGNLNKVGAKTMRVYMDACFSGDSPKGMLVRATSGISVKPRMPKKKTGSAMISITAAQGDQFASWDEDAKHGLFTKHLLTALGGTADKGRYGNGDGKVTVGEVKKYLDREMTYQARRRYNRDQVATVQGDSKLVLSSYR